MIGFGGTEVVGGGEMIFPSSSGLLVLEEDSGSVVQRLTQSLSYAGLGVTRSFDLQATRAVHTGCACPHHGTSQCNCQLIVLLVYESQSPPTTLVLEGRDGQTWVSLVHTAGERINPYLIDQVMDILKPVEPISILEESSLDAGE